MSSAKQLRLLSDQDRCPGCDKPLGGVWTYCLMPEWSWDACRDVKALRRRAKRMPAGYDKPTRWHRGCHRVAHQVRDRLLGRAIEADADFLAEVDRVAGAALGAALAKKAGG